MKSIKIAILAMVFVMVTAIASNAMIYGIIKGQSNQKKLAEVKDAFMETQQLADRVVKLTQKSEQHLNFYSDLYDDMYDKEMKLVYNHITYSSRLVSRGDSFLKNRVTVSEVQGEKASGLDLRERSALTSYEIDTFVLQNTALKGLGEAFVQAEIDHGVNAFFLLALAIHESGWGTSAIARDKNNLFGFGAFDGSAYESAVTFKTKEDGIDTVASHLAKNYLSSDGRFYSGGFTLQHVNHRYASDKQWASKIAQSMERINKNVQDKQNEEYHSLEPDLGGQ